MSEPTVCREWLVTKWISVVSQALVDAEFYEDADGVKLLREVVALLPTEECE